MRFDDVRDESGAAEEIAGGLHTLRFVRHHNHPSSRVWTALATPQGLRRWLADADLDLAPGGRVELRALHPDRTGAFPVARGRTAACERPRLVEYDLDPTGRVRAELASVRAGDGDGGAATRLELQVTRAADEQRVRQDLATWHLHLDLLARALDGRDFDWGHWAAEGLPRWRELYAFYTSERSAADGAPAARSA